MGECKNVNIYEQRQELRMFPWNWVQICNEADLKLKCASQQQGRQSTTSFLHSSSFSLYNKCLTSFLNTLVGSMCFYFSFRAGSPCYEISIFLLIIFCNNSRMYYNLVAVSWLKHSPWLIILWLWTVLVSSKSQFTMPGLLNCTSGLSRACKYLYRF